MDEQQFWGLIDLFDWSKQDEDNALAIMQPAIDKLATLSIEEVQEFDETLARKLYALDTAQHAKFTVDTDGFVYADGFLYDRCYVVARGRAFYENILRDPTQMRPFSLEVPEGFDFDSEGLLYLATLAAEQKGDFDYDPDDFTDVNYASGSNKEGWKDDASTFERDF